MIIGAIPLAEHQQFFFVGQFACATNVPGVAKITSISGVMIELEYFHSISSQSKRVFARSDLTLVRISPQARCYIKQDENWRVGRVKNTIDDVIEVDFPEKQSDFVAIQNVFVRDSSPIENPTDVLAHWGQETVFYYEKRKRMLEGLVKQRGVSGGMNGLLSSSIKLLPYQIKAAKRILEDPVPRYLLADEVGLGKTIEAGIVIRQVLLDIKCASVLIISPSALLGQWKHELNTKFHISQWPGQVSYCALEDISKLNSSNFYNLVVIDEAHHIAQWYFSENSSFRRNYSTCKTLAHNSDGLLLLSATPAIHNEEAFLCMLNMLDPYHFQIEKLSDFVQLVQKREEIGKVLFLLKEDGQDFVIRAALTSLKKLFSEDIEISLLLSALEKYFEEKSSNVEIRNQLIRKIKLMISEGYRIHRRIIRNRRSDVWKMQRKKPFIEFDGDERIEEVLNVLDKWRLEALRNTIEHPERRSQLQRIYFQFLSTLGCDVELLIDLINYRIYKIKDSVILEEVDDEREIEALNSDLFTNEQELLELIPKIISQFDTVQFDRVSLLEGRLQLLKKQNENCKVVVFVTNTTIVRKLYDRLFDSFGADDIAFINKYMDENCIENEVKLFKESTTHWILLCDRIGEEGLNLQFADKLIHYDLPWEPNRIEQRIGRLDRIGQKNEVKSYIFLGSVEDRSLSPILSYYDLLKDGLKIFDKSINTIQFIIDIIIPKFKSLLFEEGGNLSSFEIDERISAIKEEVLLEEKRTHNQDMLDQFANNEKGFDKYFSKLKELEEDPKAVELQFDPWLRGALNFKSKLCNGSVVGYEWTRFTLVPIDLLTNRFHSSTTFLGAYDRTRAAETPSPILRMGHPFIDAIADYFQWDDRGKCFALWRFSPNMAYEWQGFKFDFFVEADPSFFESLPSDIAKKSMGRRADAFFPPFLVSLYTSLDGSIVEDPEIINRLASSINKYDNHNNSSGYDYNLTKDRLAILQKNFSNSQWEDFCNKAFNKALLQVKSSAEYSDKVLSGVTNIKVDAERRESQLKIHQRHEFNQNRDNLEEEMKVFQLLVKSIQNPSVKLDSIGFFWLAPIRVEQLYEV